jgi:hypothetical protein
MFVYHVSPNNNRNSIREKGILKSKSGIDGPGVYVWVGNFFTAVKNADNSLMDCWDGDETKLENLDLWMAEIPDDTPTTTEWEDYIVLDIDKIPPQDIVLVGDFLRISKEIAAMKKGG